MVMASAFSDPRFHNEEAAFAHLESIMWPGGKPESCPCCGVVGKANKLAVQTSKPSKKNPEGKPVYGVWKCYACRQKFSVRKGHTVLLRESRLELHLWMQAAYLMCSSKKGVSANQLHRTLGVTLKTAWFMAHRLREAMAEGALNPFGSKKGGAVESDETFLYRRRRKGDGPLRKQPRMVKVDADRPRDRPSQVHGHQEPASGHDHARCGKPTCPARLA